MWGVCYTASINIKSNTMIIRGKESLTIEDLNYIAGFFDGEGNINIYKVDTKNNTTVQRRITPKFELTVSLYNTDKDVMDWLYSIFGGYFQIRNRYNNKNHKKIWKESYCVRLSSNKAIEFLEIIHPYLKVKKQQAEIAIKFQQVKKDKKNRFAKVTEEQLEFFEKSYLQLRETIDSCRNRHNGSIADKRFRPQRLTEETP